MKIIKFLTLLLLVSLLISCNDSGSFFCRTTVESSDANATPLRKIDSNYTGLYKRYSGKILKSAINYVNGIKEGQAIQYQPNGQILLIVEYKNGVKHGISKKYYPSGELYRETPYLNGERNGDMKKYYQTGEIQAIIPYKNGLQYDCPKEYTIAGQLITYKPKMVFNVVDDGSVSNNFKLEISLDQKKKDTRFFIKEIPENFIPTGLNVFSKEHGAIEYVKKELKYTPLNFDGHKAILSIYTPEGFSLNKDIEFIVCYKTRMHNVDYIKGSYMLSIAN